MPENRLALDRTFYRAAAMWLSARLAILDGDGSFGAALYEIDARAELCAACAEAASAARLLVAVPLVRAEDRRRRVAGGGAEDSGAL